LVAVTWMLLEFFKSRDLEIIGQALVLVALAGFVFVPLTRLVGIVRVPGQLERVGPRRPTIVAGTLAVAALAVIFVPLPNHVLVPLVLSPRDAARVYVTTPGLLDVVDVGPGSRVRQGETLARLTNPDVAEELQDVIASRLRLLPVWDRIDFLEHAARRASTSQIPDYQDFLLELAESLGIE